MMQDRSQTRETDYTRIKGNVSKMLTQNAPEVDIDAYLKSEGVTPEQLRTAQPVQNAAQQPWQSIKGAETSVAATGSLGNEGATSYRIPGPSDEANAGSVIFRYGDGREESVPMYDLSPDMLERFSGEYRKLYGQEPPLSLSITSEIGGNQERPTSQLQGVAEGAANVLNHGAQWLESGARAVGADKLINGIGSALGMAPSARAAVDNQREALASSPYESGGVGKFVGETAASLPLLAIPGGALAQGAAGGALMSDSSSPLGVMRDAAVGGVVSRAADSALRGAAQVAAPNIGGDLGVLLREGVRVTPGQMARASGTTVGRAVGAVEDTVAGLPGIGAPVAAAQRAGVEDLARAPVRRALRQIGAPLPRDVATGYNAIDYAQQRFRDAYNEVLPQLSGHLDNAFQRRVQAIQARANIPTDSPASQALDSATRELGNAFTGAGPNGAYNGRTLRDASERLGDLASAWRRSDDPYLRYAGDVAGQYRDQLHALARRQNPASAPRLRDIDRGYATLVRAEKAALAGDGGIPTPRQYQAAVRQSDQSARRRQFSAGNALDQDLSNAGVAVLANRASQGGSTSTNGLIALATMAGAAATGNPVAQAGGLAGLAGMGISAGVTHNPLVLRGVQALLGRQNYTSPQAAAALRGLAQVSAAPATVASTALVDRYGQ